MPVGVYKTESGLVFRVEMTEEQRLSVEVLKDGSWSPGSVGMVGLRLSPTTKTLSAKAIQALPA
jgi:hypothetical protein